MNKSDKVALDKRLENPEFEELYITLIFLLPMHYDGLIISSQTEIPKKDIKNGRLPMIMTVVQPGQEKCDVERMANDFLAEARRLSVLLSTYFPEGDRWRWQEIFMSLAMHGAGSILGERKGGPLPTSEEEKIRIVRGWHKKRGKVSQEGYAEMQGISVRTLRRWERELDKGENLD